MRFRDDRRAAALQVGAILLFGFVIILMSIWQAQVVPEENAKVEFEHYSAAQTDMMQLRSDYIDAAESGTKRSATVELGTGYPTRVAFVNAPPPQGRLYTTMPANGTITASGFDVASVCGAGSPVRTRSVRLDTEYSYLADSETPPYIYENTVLYRQTRDGGVLYESDQALVRGSTITLYPFADNVSLSGQRAATLDFSGTGTSGTSVTGAVSITLPTDLTADQWAALLNDNPNFESATQVAPQRVRIELADASWTVRCAGVSAGAAGGAAGAGDTNTPTPTPTPTPSNDLDGDKAFADADDDLQRDPGETTYNAGQLTDFDKPVNLVIPSGVGGGTLSRPKVSIRANKITSRVDMEARNNPVTLQTNYNGPVDVNGTTIDAPKVEIAANEISATGATFTASNDKVTLTTSNNGPINIDGISIDAPGLDVTANGIAAAESSITTTNDKVTLTTNNNGPVDLTKATVDVPSLDVTANEITATGSSITATNGKVTITTNNNGPVNLSKATVDVPSLDVTANEVAATGSSITADNGKVTITTNNNGPVNLSKATVDVPSLDVTANGITATGSDITADNGKVTLSSNVGPVDIRDSDIEVPSFDVTAGRITATDADLTTTNDGVELDASGSAPLDAAGIRIDAAGTVLLASGGDTYINDSVSQQASITAGGSATADHRTGSATLYVDGVEIRDADSKLVYSPNGVTVDGTPSAGRVSKN
jgi:hypothetical protein